MLCHETAYPDGLRLLVTPLPGTKSVTVLVFVGAGSRFESDRERGIAHFLEHMFFKGGAKYSTPREVAETIDGIGGDFNAFTGKEYVGYFVKCAGEHREIAFDVLSDMLTAPKLDEEDIVREKSVILEELNMYQDTPMYQIGWDFEHLLFGDTPLGRDQIGIPATIESFRRDDFAQYLGDLYTSDNIVLSIAGDITVGEARRLTEQYFRIGRLHKAREATLGTAPPLARVAVRDKKTEQAHLIVGFPAFAYGDSGEFPERLLSVILGSGMSSRMFMEVREQKGLCYSISTSTDFYSDAGCISTHAGVDLKRVPQAIEAIMIEYGRIAREGPSAEEVIKAKNYLKGKLTLRFEDSEELASYYGTQSILLNRLRSVDAAFAKVDAVTQDEIHLAAKTLFDPAHCRLASIGPFGGREAEFEQLLTF